MCLPEGVGFSELSSPSLGRRYQKEGLLDKAIGECEAVIALNPDDPHYLNTLSKLYHKTGDYDKTIATIKRGIALKPKDDVFQRQLEKFEDAKSEGQ